MAPLPKGAKVVYLDQPAAEPTREQRLVEAVRRKKAAAGEGVKKAVPGLDSEQQADLADLPGRGRSALMGLTDNMGDRVESFVDAATQNPDEQQGWVFDNSEKIHGKYMADVAKHPGSNVVGAMLQPGIPGGRIARVAGAAGHSALSNYMAGNDGPEALRDTGIAAGAGAGVQLLAEGASPLFGKVAGKLRNAAGNSAVNAAGMRGGIVNQPKRAGIHTLDVDGDDAVAALGNRMLDEGLIPFGGSKLGVQRRAESMMSQTGNAADAITTRADLAGKFDQSLGVKAGAERLAQKTDPAMGGNLQTARASDRAGDFLTDAANTPDTFKAAVDLKRGAYGNTNWGTEAPDATKLKRSTVSGYRQSIEDQVDGLLPGEGKALHDINNRHGLAAQTADFAEEAAGREKANSKLGWGSLMLAASGAGAGNALGPGAGIGLGIGLPAAAHLMKTRGAATAAPLLRLGSQGAGAAGKVVNQSPAASAATGNILEDFLKPKDDEERQEEGSSYFTSVTGRAR